MDLAKHWRMLSRTQIYFKSSTLNIVSRIDYGQKMQGEAVPISRQKTLLLWARAMEKSAKKKSQFKLTKPKHHSMCPEV